MNAPGLVRFGAPTRAVPLPSGPWQATQLIEKICLPASTSALVPSGSFSPASSVRT